MEVQCVFFVVGSLTITYYLDQIYSLKGATTPVILRCGELLDIKMGPTFCPKAWLIIPAEIIALAHKLLHHGT